MSRKKRILLIISIFVFVSLVLALTLGFYFTGQNKKIRIAVVGKTDDFTIDFWKSLYEGIELSSANNNAEFTFMAAGSESDIEKQKELIGVAIESKPDVIVLAAAGYEEIAPVAAEIEENGIRLVTIDSDVNLPEDKRISHVGTDNYAAGERIGTQAGTDLNGVSGSALIISHTEFSKTAKDRIQGFKAGFEKNASNHIFEIYHAEASEEKVYEYTKRILSSEWHINVIFATNEVTGLGAARAIDELSLKDEVSLYAFDGSLRQVQYLESGVIDCLMVQYAFKMGYRAIDIAVQAARGKSVASVVDTGSALIYRDTIYDRINQEILFPFANGGKY